MIGRTISMTPGTRAIRARSLTSRRFRECGQRPRLPPHISLPSAIGVGGGFVTFVGPTTYPNSSLYVLDALTGMLRYTVPIPKGGEFDDAHGWSGSN